MQRERRGGTAALLARISVMCAILIPSQGAAGPEAWASLQTGRALQAVDRDPMAAASVYEALLDNLADDDPLRGEVLYWLGRARFDAGDPVRARSALLRAATHPKVRPRARSFLGWMALEDRRINTLPHTENFEAGIGALVRGWGRGEEDDLGVAAGRGTGATAAWRVSVADGEEDFIAVALAPGAGRLEHLDLRLRAEGFEALMTIVVVDDEDRRWVSAEPQRIPTGRWTDLRIDTASLVGGAPAGTLQLNPSRARRVEIVDVTAYHSRMRGEHWVFIEALSLR